MKIFIVMLLLISKTLLAQVDWQVVGEMPHPIAGGQAYPNNGNVYIMGGWSDSTQGYVNWIQKYSTFLYIWKLNTYMQEARFGFASDFVGDTVYYFGGVFNPASSDSSIEYWSVPIGSNYLAENINFQRIFSSGIISNGKFYVIGGNPLSGPNFGQLPYLVEYDLATGAVSFQENNLYSFDVLPEQQMCAAIGEDIYIFGGVFNGVSQKILKFSTINHTFEELPIDLPVPRAGGSAVRIGDSNQVYIIGGYNEGTYPLSSVDIFSVTPTGYTIESGPKLNIGRALNMAAYVDNAIYVFGGYNAAAKVVSEFEKLDFSLTGVENNFDKTPTSFELSQNYPNPFNPSTKIKYVIPTFETLRAPSLQVTLKVYDILGKEVVTLVNEFKPEGSYEIEFNVETLRSTPLPSGVYFYQLQVSDPETISGQGFIETKKMIYLK